MVGSEFLERLTWDIFSNKSLAAVGTYVGDDLEGIILGCRRPGPWWLGSGSGSGPWSRQMSGATGPARLGPFVAYDVAVIWALRA